MTTARNATVVAAALAAAGAAWVPAADAGTTKRCRPKGTVTMAATSTIRVYRQRTRYTDKVYACRVRSGTRTYLGDHVDQDVAGTLIRHIRISGDFVAYSVATFSRLGTTAKGQVADTRARKIIRTVQVGRVGGTPANGAATAAVLTPRGSAAFIFDAYDEGGANARRLVIALDGPVGSAPRTLDEAPDIDPGFLALRGDTVVWRRLGPEQSAPIA